MTTQTVLTVCAMLVIGGLILTGLENGLSNAVAETPFNDAWLTAKTKIALFTDARVRGREINIESAQGLVMIRGKVDSDEAKQAVEGLAKGINGVKAVKNDLQVLLPATTESTDNKNEALTFRDQTEPCQDRFN